jgi:hypothetical protein
MNELYIVVIHLLIVVYIKNYILEDDYEEVICIEGLSDENND